MTEITVLHYAFSGGGFVLGILSKWLVVKVTKMVWHKMTK